MSYFAEMPRRWPAIAALATLATLSAIATILSVVTRAWFTLLIPLGGALLATGYGLRLARSAAAGVYAAMQALLVASPLLLAAANYKCLGIAADVPRVGWAFVGADVLCVALQVTGASLFASRRDEVVHAGAAVALAGTVAALAVNAAFLGALLYVNLESRPALLGFSPALWVALYATTVLLLLRSTYRVVEFVQVRKSMATAEDRRRAPPAITREKYLYFLDFVPVALCMAIYCALHFGWYL